MSTDHDGIIGEAIATATDPTSDLLDLWVFPYSIRSIHPTEGMEVDIVGYAQKKEHDQVLYIEKTTEGRTPVQVSAAHLFDVAFWRYKEEHPGTITFEHETIMALNALANMVADSDLIAGSSSDDRGEF